MIFTEVILKCDNCEAKQRIEVRCYANGLINSGSLTTQIKDMGWSIQKVTDECYCRECTRKKNANTVSKK